MDLNDWPNNWPQDCPPADANALPLTVYHVTANNPPVASDFMSWLERGKKSKPGKDCERCGVSVFLDIRDAQHHLKLFNRWGKFIAKGDLPVDSGKAKKTESSFPSHVTWWVKNGIVREQFFKCVDV
jgi:hypothetical protein